MDVFQMIPILALTGYFFYLTYYYAAPMFYLKVLLFFAHRKYRCREIRFTEEKVTVKIEINGEERTFEQPLGIELESRFFASTLCTVFRKVLSDIRRYRKGETDAP